MQKNNYFLANTFLAGFTILFLASYPFRDNFWLGALSSMSGAAMIGGLTDWVGVTAIFRKPWGMFQGRFFGIIPIRTEIIKRNRERIYNDLSSMVEKELLTKESLRAKIDSYDAPALILRYLNEHGGKNDLKEIFQKVAQDVLNSFDPQEVGVLVEKLLLENVDKLKLAPLLSEVAVWTVKNGYDERVIDFTLDELVSIVGKPQTHDLLKNLLNAVRDEYKEGQAMREFFDSFIVENFSDEIIVAVSDKLAELLQEMKKPENVARKGLRNWVEEKVQQFNKDEELLNKLENWKTQQLYSLSISNNIAVYFENLRQAAATKSGNVSQLFNVFDTYFDKLLVDFADNHVQRSKLDIMVKTYLREWLNVKHSSISKLVHDRLNRYSSKEIVKLVEEKIGNDLQWVRINGSIVGGLIGLLAHLFTFFGR